MRTYSIRSSTGLQKWQPVANENEYGMFVFDIRSNNFKVLNKHYNLFIDALASRKF